MAGTISRVAAVATALSTLVSATSPPPTSSLYPAIHGKHDAADLAHLSPQASGADGAPLFYAQDEDAATDTITQAFMTPQFKHHSVVLDHSRYVQDVQMSAEGDLAISFNDVIAYNMCLEKWNADGGLIFVTHTPGCGGHEDGERCYFKAEDLDWDHDTKQVVASGNALSLSDAVHQYKLSFGVIKPDDVDEDEAVLPVESENEISSIAKRQEGEESSDEETSDDETPSGPVKNFLNGLGDVLDFLSDEFEATIPFYFRTTRMIIPPRFSECHDSAEGPNPCRPVDRRLRVVKSPFTSGDDILLGAFGEPNGSGRYGKRRDITYHCVDCGLEGTVIISGEVVVTPFEGIIGGHIQMETFLDLAARLGIEGSMSNAYNSPEMIMWSAELIGIDIPGTIKIDPRATVSAQLNAQAAIMGSFLGGAEWTFAKMLLKYDFATRKTTLQHFDPSVIPILEINGDARTQATLTLPFELSINVGLFKGECKLCQWGIALHVIPTTTVVVHTGGVIGLEETNGTYTVTGSFTTHDDCKGVSVENIDHTTVEATVNVAGKIFQETLAEFGPNVIMSKCLPFVKDPERGTERVRSRRSLPASAHNATEIRDITDEIVSKEILGSSGPFKHDTARSEPHGVEFDRLEQRDSDFLLAACTDGSVRMAGTDALGVDSDCGNIWVYVEGNVIADGAERHLQYDTDMMDRAGVSRLRVSGRKDASYSDGTNVLLHPIGENGAMVAIDQAKQHFFPAYCTFADEKQPPELFLLADATSGVDMLENGNVKGSVTGARALTCSLTSIVHRE